MPDSLGWRRKFGVIAPSTNTSVQPEYDEMRPAGVTNHHARIHIPDDPVESDADFNALMDNIRREFDQALGVAIDVRPHVEDRGDSLHAGPADHQARTLDIHAHAQDQQRDGHQGAGVASRD